MECIICHSSVVNKSIPLCGNCRSNPFRVEKARDVFAKNKKFGLLERTYNQNFSEILDVNSPEFWDMLFSKNKRLEEKSPITKDRISTVIRMIKNQRGKLLDVGFGWGFIEKGLLKLRRNKLSFYGIDISRIAVAEAKRTLPGKFIQGSILKIPFPSDYFDLVVSLEVLEHILPFQTFKALGELWRVLKKRSFLIISVPLNESLEVMCKKGLNPSGHVRAYTSELVKTELKIAGFKILKEKYFYAFKNSYWLKNFLRKIILKSRWQPNNILLVAQKP